VSALRKAFHDVLADAELVAEANKASLDIGPQSGDEVQKLVEKLYATPPDLIAFLRKGMSAP
jgi:tripartite-type tricarboxylate transporter receptor subunit TctC